MKRKIFSVLFALVLAVSFSLMMAVPAMAQVTEVWVDDEFTETTEGWGVTHFATIQEGITAVDPGGTVNVAAGTYTEDVNVDVTGITLQAESLDAIVDGGFRTRVSDITIDGFTIMNGAAGPTSYFPAGIAADDPDGQSGHSFTNNVIIGAGPDDPKTGIYLKNCTGTLIDDNEIYGGSSRAIAFITFSHDTTITNNNIHDCMGGICPGQSNDAIIRFNQVHDNTAEGMQLFRCDGLSINLNNIYNNVACGICYYDNTNLDATLNWWGDASGPGPGGSGDSVICDHGTAVASYSPWLGATVGTSPMTFIVDDVGTAPTAGYIQTAANGASAGDTISVADGTYDEGTFPIDVDVANLTIQSVSGAATTTIDSVAAGQVIAISAAGATIGGTDKGFRIMGEGAVADGLIYIGANDATITENHFVGDYYLMVLGPGVSGATVEDNIFLADGTPETEVTGVYVNNDVTGSTFDGNFFPLGDESATFHVDSGIYMAPGTTADQTITISNNTFEGMGLREYNESQMGCGAIELDGVGGITINDNRIVNSNDGIYLRGVNALTGDVTIQSNTIINNAWGIEVKDGVGTVGTITANYNSLVGNTTYGFENAETDITVDAKYNWWGDAAGPSHAGNPYDDPTGGNEVSYYVDYIPWLIHTELASGWNIYSTPIALDSSCDTIAKALDIWTTANYSGNLEIGYYFDSSASPQAWSSDITTLTPLQAYYLNMSAAATIDVISNTSYTAPPSRVMYQGWNLIGPAELYSMNVDDALGSAYWASGAANLVGYSQVISPPLHQTATWTHLRGSKMYATFGWGIPDMIPTEGYWVYMVNQGTVGGFTSTPITIDTTP